MVARVHFAAASNAIWGCCR